MDNLSKNLRVKRAKVNMKFLLQGGKNNIKQGVRWRAARSENLDFLRKIMYSKNV